MEVVLVGLDEAAEAGVPVLGDRVLDREPRLLQGLDPP